MKFLLLSRHTGGKEVPENKKEQNAKDFFEWITLLKASAVLPVAGGKTVTIEHVEDYQGNVAGALFFEADSLEAAVELAKKSPGLQYGWTHDILQEMSV
jgi:hypothetical protein